MYILFVVLIIIASILMIFTVLAQNPKSGMAANLGASNQVMGARQTSDFLEKFTWTLAISIVILSLLASIAMSYARRNPSGDKIIDQVTTESDALPASDQSDAMTLPAIPTAEDGPAAEETSTETAE